MHADRPQAVSLFFLKGFSARKGGREEEGIKEKECREEVLKGGEYFFFYPIQNGSNKKS